MKSSIKKILLVIFPIILGLVICIQIFSSIGFGTDYVMAVGIKGASSIEIKKIRFESSPDIQLLPLTFDSVRFQKAEEYIEEQRKQRIAAEKAAEEAAAIAARNRIAFPSTNYSGNMEQMIRDKFGENAEKALIIARCESGLNPNSIGDRGLLDANGYGASYGLFQIRYLRGRPTPTQLLEPSFNINYAYNMSGGGTNWSAWSCKKKL